MNEKLPSPLSPLDTRILLVVEKIVPVCERREWSRTWEAELWHRRDRSRNRRMPAKDLSLGLISDAVWLRTDSWRRGFEGTPLLCLASLVGLCLVSGLVALGLHGDRHSLSASLSEEFGRSIFEAPLVIFVAFATASRRQAEESSATKMLRRMKCQIFFAAKILLVLILMLLMSGNMCQPLHAHMPIVADLLQTFLFVLLVLVGLRWAFRDQEERCKQCLHSLAPPARVGRPSHNLLEWNGTELLCRHGHGLLSVPEMESSWCQSSQWVVLESGWDQGVRT